MFEELKSKDGQTQTTLLSNPSNAYYVRIFICCLCKLSASSYVHVMPVYVLIQRTCDEIRAILYNMGGGGGSQRVKGEDQ